MTSRRYLMLRSAQRARLEARTIVDGSIHALSSSSSSSAFASLRSGVSKPSVNQP
jgi:hypothetical protein